MAVCVLSVRPTTDALRGERGEEMKLNRKKEGRESNRKLLDQITQAKKGKKEGQVALLSKCLEESHGGSLGDVAHFVSSCLPQTFFD